MGLLDQVVGTVSEALSRSQEAGLGKAALGSDTIAALAQKAGLSPDQTQEALSHLLPNLVDRLTPNGKVPQAHSLAPAGLSVLMSILGTPSEARRVP